MAPKWRALDDPTYIHPGLNADLKELINYLGALAKSGVRLPGALRNARTFEDVATFRRKVQNKAFLDYCNKLFFNKAFWCTVPPKICHDVASQLVEIDAVEMRDRMGGMLKDAEGPRG